MLAKRNGKLIAWVICGNNFVRITTHSESRLWNMAKSTRKGEFHSCAVFQQKPCWEMDIMSNVNFTLSDSNNKDQLSDLYNYLNQKVTTAINTYDSSTLGNNLITSHQVILCPQRSFQLKLLKITISIL